MQVKAGSYTGNGTDNRTVIGVGFQPDVVIVKRADTGDTAFFRTASMASGNSMTLRGDSGLTTGGIKTLDYDGFTLGTNAEVNSNTVTYYYLAVKKDASNDFDYGTYTGNGTDSRSITLQSNFPFTWLVIKGDGGRTGAYKNKDLTGDKTHAFYSAGTNSDQIQATMSTSDGTVELGTSDFVNANSRTYYWFGFKEVAGLATSFTYAGDGNDNRNITIPGTSFQPGFVWIKQEDANDPRLRTSAHSGDSSQSFDGATETNSIQGFNSTGFQVGNNSQVNASSKTYHVLALKENAPTSVTAQVSASSDDARNLDPNSTASITVTTQHLGKFNTTDKYWNGWRFLSLAIPQGATIVSATLDLYSAQTAAGTTAKAIFYGNAVDNATTFNSTTEKPQSKSLTTASATKDLTVSLWSAGLGFNIEPVDVTTIIQEIVNRSGWSSGNALSIIGYDNGSSNTNYIGHSTYDRATDRGAKLTVAYTVASAAKTQTGISRITATTQKTQTGKSNVRNTTQKTQTGKSRITATTQQTQTGKAKITAITSRTQTGVARVTVTTQRTQPGIARITATTTRTQTGVANITANATTSRTITGKSAIQKTTSQNQTGIAKITATTLKTQTGKAKITATTQRTQSGIARVTNTTPRSQTGLSRINNTVLRTQNSVSRITKTVPQTQTGKARITVTTLQIINGKSNSRNTAVQTETGKSRITNTVSKITTGTGRIQKTALQTISGVSRVQKTTSQTQIGKANLRNTTQQTISGKANISNTVTTQRIQTGKGNVRNTTTQIISGSYKIVGTKWIPATKPSNTVWTLPNKPANAWTFPNKPSTNWTNQPKP